MTVVDIVALSTYDDYMLECLEQKAEVSDEVAGPGLRELLDFLHVESAGVRPVPDEVDVQ